EGPVEFTDDDITPVVRSYRRRYYTGPDAEVWINEPLTDANYRQNIAVLRPELMTGYRWETSL
ncbi:MAG TPA: hypothetical protein VLA06_01200, partial [Woeseiaceae bacterium]|nr:hypothetical protein [Woeseiaceae bacterium]